MSDITFTKSTPLSPETFNPIFQSLESRLKALEAVEAVWSSAVDVLTAEGIKRINTALAPSYERLQRVTELGFLTASSATDLAWQTGQTSLIIHDEDERELFAPAPFVVVGRQATWEDYLIAAVLGYDAASGELQLDVLHVENMTGADSYLDLFVAATAGSAVAEIEAHKQVRELHSQAETFKDQAQAAQVEAADLRDQVVSDLNQVVTLEQAASASASAAKLDADRAAALGPSADLDAISLSLPGIEPTAICFDVMSDHEAAAFERHQAATSWFAEDLNAGPYLGVVSDLTAAAAAPGAAIGATFWNSATARFEVLTAIGPDASEEIFAGARADKPRRVIWIAHGVMGADPVRVIGLDATDPTLPLWRSFVGLDTGGYKGSYLQIAGGSKVTSLAAVAGKTFVGIAEGGAPTGLLTWDWLGDHALMQSAANGKKSRKPFARRNESLCFGNDDGLPRFAGTHVHDLVARVEPGAPLDPVTSLPWPTVVVATDQGGSALLAADNIVDVTGMQFVGVAWAGDRLNFVQTDRQAVSFGPLPTQDLNYATWRDGFYYGDWTSVAYTNHESAPVIGSQQDLVAAEHGFVCGGWSGLSWVYTDPVIAGEFVAIATDSYATGLIGHNTLLAMASEIGAVGATITDRGPGGNDLTVTGNVQLSPVNGGDLELYTGWAANSHVSLSLPEIGVQDFSVRGILKLGVTPQTSSRPISIGYLDNYPTDRFLDLIVQNAGANLRALFNGESNGSVDIDPTEILHFDIRRENGKGRFYLNGRLVDERTLVSVVSIPAGTPLLVNGMLKNSGDPTHSYSLHSSDLLGFVRLDVGTLPDPVDAYDAEKVLSEPGVSCLLPGSPVVTALAHDSDAEQLLVAGPGGLSRWKGLRRLSHQILAAAPETIAVKSGAWIAGSATEALISEPSKKLREKLETAQPQQLPAPANDHAPAPAKWILDQADKAVKDQALLMGLHSATFQAAGLSVSTSGGAAISELSLSGSGRIFQTLEFDPVTEQAAQLLLPMPKSWDGGGVFLDLCWTGPAGSGDVVWAVDATALGDGLSLDQGWGSAVTLADSFVAADQAHDTGRSEIVLPNGAGRQLSVRIRRLAADSADTYDQVCRLISATLIYRVTTGSDQ